MPEVQQFLEINPCDFDRKFVSLLKRLEEATMKKEIIELMQRENLIQEEWEEMQRSLEEERKQKDILLKRAILGFLELGLNKPEIAKKLSVSIEKIDELSGC